MNPTPYLFLYGSLRQGFNNPAFAYISNYFTLVGNATVQGKLVDMGNYPVGVPDNDNTIIGELYQLNEMEQFDWAFSQLDDYEGLHVEENEIPLFLRKQTTVTLLNKTVNQSWIYWYNGDVTNKPTITSGDIFEYIKNK